jgi:hypothetical protein
MFFAKFFFSFLLGIAIPMSRPRRENNDPVMYEESSDYNSSKSMSDDEFFATEDLFGMDDEMLNPVEHTMPDPNEQCSSKLKDNPNAKTKRQLTKEKLVELNLLEPFPRPLSPRHSYYSTDGNL